MARAKHESWRERQDLVQRIEAAIGPDAVVTSPDFLTDKSTGRRREVDVSIRSRVGSQPILIIEECRDHKRKVPVTYVEQIAKKREDLGADRAVIVSTVGFTEGATMKADHHSIGLMTLREAMDTDWSDWLAMNRVTMRKHRSQAIHIELVPADAAEKQQTPRSIDIADPVQLPLVKADGGSWGTVGGAFMGAANLSDVFQTLIPDAPPVRRQFSVRFSDGPVFIDLDDRLIEIEQINFEVQLWIESEEIPLRRYEYSEPGGTTGVRYADALFEIANSDETSLQARVFFVNEPTGTRVFAEVVPKEITA